MITADKVGLVVTINFPIERLNSQQEVVKMIQNALKLKNTCIFMKEGRGERGEGRGEKLL